MITIFTYNLPFSSGLPPFTFILPLILRNLGNFLMITISMGSYVAHVIWKYVDYFSATFTASFIFNEMATGNRSRIAQIFHKSFCKIIIPRVVYIFDNIW